MHPDLYLVVYRQAERELERRIERARVTAERRSTHPVPARLRATRTAPSVTRLPQRLRVGRPAAPAPSVCVECPA